MLDDAALPDATTYDNSNECTCEAGCEACWAGYDMTTEQLRAWYARTRKGRLERVRNSE